MAEWLCTTPGAGVQRQLEVPEPNRDRAGSHARTAFAGNRFRPCRRTSWGGLLFIDEAYYLYKVENECDYGSEAIEILLQVMENNRDDLAVILAGYADKMDQFFSANPGMQSRIAHHITFPDYAADELEEIAGLMTYGLGYSLSPDARKALHKYLDLRIQPPWFANARSVRNAMERARLRHANRLFKASDTHVDLAALTTIEASDLLSSRVFDTADAQPE